MLTIGMLASIPAILAIVNLCKSYGLKGNWSAVLAVVLGVAINLANFFLGADPAYQVAVSGLLMGLAAAGFYDVGKSAATKVSLGMAPRVQLRGSEGSDALRTANALRRPSQ